MCYRRRIKLSSNQSSVTSIYWPNSNMAPTICPNLSKFLEKLTKPFVIHPKCFNIYVQCTYSITFGYVNLNIQRPHNLHNFMWCNYSNQCVNWYPYTFWWNLLKITTWQSEYNSRYWDPYFPNSVSRKQEAYEATHPLQRRECFSPNAKHECICMPVPGFAS